MKKALQWLILASIALFMPLQWAKAETYVSNGNTHKLLFDDNGTGYSDGSTRSTDGSNSFVLIGGLESYDTGYGNTAGGAYAMKSGLQPTFEANVAAVAELLASDGSIQLYDRLIFQINPNGNPTSADGVQFAVQIAPTSDFTSYQYINPTNMQPDLVTNADLSTYYSTCAQSAYPADPTNWDCGNTTDIRYLQGLAVDTQYCVRVVAMNGDATNSEPGPAACQRTNTMELTFTRSASQTNFGVLSATSVTTSTPDIVLTSTTNAAQGYTVYLQGTGSGSGNPSGLYSSSKTYLIASTSGNLDASIGTEGYGMQAEITAGSPTLNTTDWDPTQPGRNGTWVGQIVRNTTKTVYSNLLPTPVDRVTTSYLANISSSTVASNDYRDILIFTMSASW